MRKLGQMWREHQFNRQIKAFSTMLAQPEKYPVHQLRRMKSFLRSKYENINRDN